MHQQLKVAYLQQDTVWENPAANRAAAERLLGAVEADVIVLPETFTTGFSDNMARMAEPPEGPTLRWAQQLAATHNALVAATWIVADGQGTYNRMHLVQPDGHWQHYDKAHTFRVSSESEQINRGTSRTTVQWRGWRIRVAVCYDLRFPLWLRNSVTPNGLDYDLLLICANWPASRAEAWTTLLKARAIENQAYVVGVNRTGTDEMGTPYSGRSAAYDYCGRSLSACRPGCQQLAVTTLNKPRLDKFREHWPFYLDFDTNHD